MLHNRAGLRWLQGAVSPTRKANIKAMRRGIDETRRWMQARLKDTRHDEEAQSRLRARYQADTADEGRLTII